MQFGATDPRFADEQSEQRLSPMLAQALHGQTLFTNLEILPALMLERGPDPSSPEYPLWAQAHADRPPRPVPVKTVPAHHSPVRLASEGDIAEIFGSPDKAGNFIIGYTREQGHAVCVDLKQLVQRSAGVFGATGTGKSFLTRLVLAGLIQHNKASVLVLDMHNEYGYDSTDFDSGRPVPGLKSKFASRVRVVGLGRGAAIRGAAPDFNLEIAEGDISTVGHRAAHPRTESQGDHRHHAGCPVGHLQGGVVQPVQGHDAGRHHGGGWQKDPCTR